MHKNISVKFKKILKFSIRICLLFWFLIVVFHSVFVGKIFIFNSTGNIPGICFFIIPVLFLIPEILQKKKNFIFLFMITVSFIIGILQADINIPISTKENINSDSIKILNWNTNCWDQNKNRDEFYNYLKNSQADIYILQEYLHARDWSIQEYDQSQIFSIFSKNFFFPLNYVKVNDSKKLKIEFPDFHIATHGQFVIISRFPILDSYLDDSEQYMVTDLKIREKTLRIFNVHLLLHIEPVSPFLSYFYIALQNRFYAREIGISNLKRDINSTQNEYLISGDFNSTKAMGVIQSMLKDHIDAISFSGELFPVTFEFFGLSLWRFDYFMIPKKDSRLIISEFNNLEYTNLSDHKAQEIYLSFEEGK